MKLTKIVATVGPNVLHQEGIMALLEAGVDVFRFNFKHNTVDWHSQGMQMINEIIKKYNIPAAIMIDLQGPSIRISMPTPDIHIEKGEKLYFGEKVFDGKLKGFSITHPHIIPELTHGQTILADDGLFRFDVDKQDSETFLIAQSTGKLLNNKALNIPGASFPFPVLVDRDFEGIELSAREMVDYIALSFVRSAADIQTLRDEMAKFDIKAKIVAKIETKMALDHLDEIIDAADAVMVARGDLGVELPFEEVPYYQKLIINTAIQKCKPVITATQMLNSMIEQPLPTRAEVSDVANAIYDLTDAVMLSGETAYGQYPFETVQAMNRICTFNEAKMTFDIRKRYSLPTLDDESKICEMAYNLYMSFVKQPGENFGGFVIFTKTGKTARYLSRYRPRPNMPIFAFAESERTRRELCLSFGVVPYVNTLLELQGNVQRDQIRKALSFLKGEGQLKDGQSVIVLHGDTWAVEGGTSTVKLVKV